MSGQTIILGGGITGLATGAASGLPVYEAAEVPGGICSSYYMHPKSTERLYSPPADREVYRFEIGGGHWIFGGDPVVLQALRTMTPVRTYARKSSVYFPESKLAVPYPLQNHLRFLGGAAAAKALSEMVAASAAARPAGTMAEWLRTAFGDSLCELFFDPFHQLYTAGLWKEIAPQDAYKSPSMLASAVSGAFGDAPAAGYNVTFVYPEQGLDALARSLASQCKMHYGKRVARLEVRKQEILFTDGSGVGYERLISTLPLTHVMNMAGLKAGIDPDPYTSVLVVNIGAMKGPRCPDDHWVYLPKTRGGFHRVGFYSNVDASFLPRLPDSETRRVSIYVERAYRSDRKPTPQDVATVCETIVAELREWGWIGEVEVVDPTWIEVAYTWSRPGSRWKAESMKLLESHGIFQVGRYARWVFQGIADSIRDGFIAGGAFKSP